MKDDPYLAGCLVWIALLGAGELVWVVCLAVNGSETARDLLALPVFLFVVFVLPPMIIGYGIARYNRWKGSRK